MNRPKIEEILESKGKEMKGILDDIRNLVAKENMIDDLEREQTIHFRGKNKERLEGFIQERIEQLQQKYGEIKTQVSLKSESPEFVFEMDWAIVKK